MHCLESDDPTSLRPEACGFTPEIRYVVDRHPHSLVMLLESKETKSFPKMQAAESPEVYASWYAKPSLQKCHAKNALEEAIAIAGLGLWMEDFDITSAWEFLRLHSARNRN